MRDNRKGSGAALDELAKEYEGKLIIFKVDTEREIELATVFGIECIPASCLYLCKVHQQYNQELYLRRHFNK